MRGFIIKGGAPLAGEVIIDGAKNAALGILAGSLLTDDDIIIENIPDVSDINLMIKAIGNTGARVDRLDAHSVRINCSTIAAAVLTNICIAKAIVVRCVHSTKTRLCIITYLSYATICDDFSCPTPIPIYVTNYIIIRIIAYM
jgi:hypothetical protein